MALPYADFASDIRSIPLPQRRHFSTLEYVKIPMPATTARRKTSPVSMISRAKEMRSRTMLATSLFGAKIASDRGLESLALLRRRTGRCSTKQPCSCFTPARGVSPLECGDRVRSPHCYRQPAAVLWVSAGRRSRSRPMRCAVALRCGGQRDLAQASNDFTNEKTPAVRECDRCW